MVTVKVCIPTSDRLQSHCLASLNKLLAVSHAAQSHVLVHDIYKSCYVYSARNWLVGGSWCVPQAQAAALLYDYYWFIDSDIGGFDFELLDIMIKRRELAITVPYEPKDRDGTLVAGNIHWQSYGNFRVSCMPVNYPHPTCEWSGMGCTLFHQSVFTKKLCFPWFEPKVISYMHEGQEYREVVGEDIAISLAMHAQKIPFHIQPWGLIHKVDSHD